MAAALLGLPAPLCAQAANGVGSPFELAFWQSVSGSDDPAVYEAYLQQYPAGTFAGLARVKLATLRKASLPAPAIASAPPPVAAPPAQVVPAVATVAPPPPPPSRPPVPVVAPDPAPVRSEPKVVAVSAPVAASADASQATSDANLLLELARSQEAGAGTGRVAAAQGFSVPPRPVLSDVTDLPLPTAFCSADQRNAFYETRYKPLLDVARANNAAAIAYMQKLQQDYDSYQLARDPTPMNVLAAEASAYQQQVAASTYARQAALVRQFDEIMAVPINSCQIATATK
ncbi:hypothetical protein [Novosphingobium taihuense]|uniref:Uncharacterized protein n=1 Tax=Novosphingobium taihuense TaxID=260085 RepID=A0A7W7AE50_9SPHN|nr:hypothetical protein [Novosphingobium taihuense]MBB4615323.1 hypothetical protein [Novosphingobium taihuense]